MILTSLVTEHDVTTARSQTDCVLQLVLLAEGTTPRVRIARWLRPALLLCGGFDELRVAGGLLLGSLNAARPVIIAAIGCASPTHQRGIGNRTAKIAHTQSAGQQDGTYVDDMEPLLLAAAGPHVAPRDAVQ